MHTACPAGSAPAQEGDVSGCSATSLGAVLLLDYAAGGAMAPLRVTSVDRSARTLTATVLGSPGPNGARRNAYALRPGCSVHGSPLLHCAPTPERFVIILRRITADNDKLAQNPKNG